MSKFSLALLAVAVLALGACYQHDAGEVKYYFTQQLPKKQKQELKAEYKRLLADGGQGEPRRAEPGAPRSLFPADDL